MPHRVVVELDRTVLIFFFQFRILVLVGLVLVNITVFSQFLLLRGPIRSVAQFKTRTLSCQLR